MIIDIIKELALNFALGAPFAIILDYALNDICGRREWIWQTWWRLRKEHKRLYPRKSHADDGDL